MSKSILYLGGFELPDKNAAAQRVIANAKLLRGMGYEVSFMGISKDIANAPGVVDGFTSSPVPYPINVRQWIHQILSFVESEDLFDNNWEYVVLYNFPSIASLRILNACHKRGIKVIHDLTEWESASGCTPRQVIRKLDINLRMRYCMKRMDGVICISRYLYDYYKDYTNCILTPPTIDLNDPKWNRDRMLSTGENVNLVYAGSAGFRGKDRLDSIIEALQGKIGISLTVIGMTKEQYEQGYGKNVPESVLVEFRGRVPHMDAVKAVQEADFQMLIRDSNLKNNAGFPTKFVESISCCTPVIATLTSNIDDYLQDGVNGFIVSSERPLSALFSELSSLSKDKIVVMKQACREFKGFDYRSFTTEFSKIFK